MYDIRRAQKLRESRKEAKISWPPLKLDDATTRWKFGIMSLQFYRFWEANDSILSTVSEQYQAFQIISSVLVWI